MRKLCARWVSRLLTIDQKSIRVTTSEQNLVYLNRSPEEFLRRFVTRDETWIHHYMRCVRKVSDLRSYLHVGAILRHPERGILRISPHLIEPHAPGGASTS